MHCTHKAHNFAISLPQAEGKDVRTWLKGEQGYLKMLKSINKA